jgi:hypothetical protein
MTKKRTPRSFTASKRKTEQKDIPAAIERYSQTVDSFRLAGFGSPMPPRALLDVGLYLNKIFHLARKRDRSKDSKIK